MTTGHLHDAHTDLFMRMADLADLIGTYIDTNICILPREQLYWTIAFITYIARYIASYLHTLHTYIASYVPAITCLSPGRWTPTAPV
jgi:hypothetical protein